MSADFWAGYISGAIGILVGNPLDVIKTRLQAGPSTTTSSIPSTTAASEPAKLGARPWTQPFERWTALARGAAAPILGYGALNALLFVTYNRSLALLRTGSLTPGPAEEGGPPPGLLGVWTAGALGGLATCVVSAPTELVKCRAQVAEPARSSWAVARDLWRRGGGLRGLYVGAAITSARDALGYGFYFWSYQLSKRALAHEDDGPRDEAWKVLLCGGLAGVVTWASIFPLDVIKTRVQTFDLRSPAPAKAVVGRESQPLLAAAAEARSGGKPDIFARPSTWQITKEIYRTEGVAVFFRGLGICSARAFIVNAIQWAMYEWTMRLLT